MTLRANLRKEVEAEVRQWREERQRIVHNINNFKTTDLSVQVPLKENTLSSPNTRLDLEIGQATWKQQNRENLG